MEVLSSNNLKNALLLKQLYLRKQLGYNYTSMTAFTEETTHFTLPNNLVNVKKQADVCHLCLLSKSRNHVVFGEGNPHATLMFIGDMPSTSDDSSGKIFTGRTGELFDNMINKVLHLERKDVYITHLIKCRISQKESLTQEYIDTCYPFLHKEIELIQPKVIVTLGQMAYEYISKTSEKIEKVHGIAHTINNSILIPMYHPHYLLRNPSSKKEAWEDLLNIKSYLSQNNKHEEK